MFAVVTGTKKGIWHDIIRRLTLECLTVVLTARDKKIGSNTVSLLVKYGLEKVCFYQLDVQDQSSADSFAKYVKTQFGRLDILKLSGGSCCCLCLRNSTNAPREQSRLYKGMREIARS
ncbi:hypothetical protein MKX03_012690 [Papaver bracteatum]|nr:hypothetical protein MKX03_012690 [Papaver bracteatum]